jgi:hypothetical protein
MSRWYTRAPRRLIIKRQVCSNDRMVNVHRDAHDRHNNDWPSRYGNNECVNTATGNRFMI